MTRSKRTVTEHTEKAGKLKPGHYHAWLTLPEEHRLRVTTAAGSVGMLLSEFARRAIQEAVERYEEGEAVFSDSAPWVEPRRRNARR